ncbi:hypothetical protein ACFC1T_08190 [Kitasatospora sp. NPDC056076]|uniref:hypothetical protein n=1 Tax=Kitasatospora sp. NPDC056076 TaxID=3345703 RepID=UPI0035E0D1A3
MAAHLIPVEMPAQLRKWAVYKLTPETDGQHELVTLCKAVDEGRSNCASVIGLTNVALGAAVEIAREWRHSKNGNEVQAGRTLLKGYEMTYVPEDPRERRHEFKMPGSISNGVPGQLWQLKDRPEVVADLKGCSWTMSGASGRVTHETLGWLLEWAEGHVRADSSAGQRAGRKFIATFRPAWEETGHLIAEHLGEGQQEPEKPVVEQATVKAEKTGRDWQKAKLSRYVRWDAEPSCFWFGGTAKAGAADPVGTLVSLNWSESVKGQNILRDIDSGEIVATVHSMSQVWAAPVDQEERAVHQDQDQDQEPVVEVESTPEPAEKVPAAELGPVPENWVLMAEEAHTETARAWWRRKVESWGR